MAFVSIPKEIPTKGFRDCHDITEEVKKDVSKSGITAGLVTVFITGSTAGITTIEYEDGAVMDFIDTIEKIIPQDGIYKHNLKWGDGNGFSHARGALIGPSITIPLVDSKLQLGQWQQIILIDFDNKERTRKYLVNILGD